MCCAIRLHIAVFFQQKIIFALKTLECHKGTGRITIKSGPFSSRMPMISLRSAMNAAAQSKTMTGLGLNPQVKYRRTSCDCYMICYIFHFLHPYCPSRTLRSLGTSLLTVPRFSLETFGKISFSVFGPTVWNSLPLSLRKKQCFTTFSTKHKTNLFHIHLC